MKLSIIISSALISSAAAFSPSAKINTSRKSTELEATVSRRSILSKSASAALASVGFLATTTSNDAAFAELSKGDSLPDGAAQFKRMLSLKSDLPAVIKRLEEGAADGSIDKKEWDALSDFMRKVYKGGEDMKAFTKGGSFYDPDKKKKAEDDYKFLQKLAQAGDGPISKEDAAGLAGILKKAVLTMDDFFELLRDVPDEI